MDARIFFYLLGLIPCLLLLAGAYFVPVIARIMELKCFSSFKLCIVLSFLPFVNLMLFMVLSILMAGNLLFTTLNFIVCNGIKYYDKLRLKNSKFLYLKKPRHLK